MGFDFGGQSAVESSGVSGDVANRRRRDPLEMVTDYTSYGMRKLNKRGNTLAATLRLLAAVIWRELNTPFLEIIDRWVG